MQAENWKKIDELLNQCLDLPPAERADFIASVDSPELRRELKSLLRYEEISDNFLKDSAVAVSAVLLENGRGERKLKANEKIGNYTVIGELGIGGMGAVFLGKSTDGKFTQKVALKLLRRELNTQNIRRSFQRERQILATLHHPNIAHLLDAGTTDDGIPFLAMEYVEGVPIDKFCDEKRLDLGERLELFLRVCETVAFAHGKLIVHRDLKPSNILITADGLPKLLDFGISKLLSVEQENAESQTITRLGAMTPEYASPEQMRGESVSTATDIYSLGVILYKLLTGSRPFEKKSGKKEFIDLINETDPLKPSEVRSTQKVQISSNETSSDAFKSKVTRPFSLTKLQGDLDNIILKALKKEPERRYSSVEQFAGDIRRHLNGLPVLARPDTFAYRSAKFIKRNKLGVATVGLIFLILIGGIISTIWQARRAEKRFNEVRQIANTFLFEISPEIENLPGSSKARELLVKRALEYLDKLSVEAEDNLQLQLELAAAYEKVGNLQGNPSQQNLGDLEGALKSYLKAREIRLDLINKTPNDHEQRLGFARNLALSGDVQWWMGNTTEATARFDESMAILNELIAQKSESDEILFEQAVVFELIGSVFFWNSDNKTALEKYEQARQIFERLHEQTPESIRLKVRLATLLARIGEALSWDSRPDEATATYKKGIELIQPLAEQDANNYLTQRTLMNLYLKSGENYSWEKQWREAQTNLEKAEQISEKLVQADPLNFHIRRDHSINKNVLGDLYINKGESGKGIEYFLQALEIQKQLASIDDKNFGIKTDLANTGKRISEAYFAAKKFSAAIESANDVLENYRQLSAADPEDMKLVRYQGVMMQFLGNNYFEVAKNGNNKTNWKKALDHFEKSRQIFDSLRNKNVLTSFDEPIFSELEKKIEFCRKNI